VKVDPTQIDQILMNLAVNARDAMPDGGSLTLETANVTIDTDYAERHLQMAPGAYVLLAVSDNGIGMDTQTRKHIFEPFFTTKKENGTGLGLSTVYGIVKQSGGHIWVYSEPGVGTTFKMYFPAIPDGARVVYPSKPCLDVARGNEMILLVEDDAALRESTRANLEAMGYSVLTAALPSEAVAIATASHLSIDLLLTDVVLPEMNGSCLARQIVSIRPHIKVLYVSGYTDNVVRETLTSGGAFLQKPFARTALSAKLRELLDDKPSADRLPRIGSTR
jgi:CheY-like chemotaxis protein